MGYGRIKQPFQTLHVFSLKTSTLWPARMGGQAACLTFYSHTSMHVPSCGHSDVYHSFPVCKLHSCNSQAVVIRCSDYKADRVLGNVCSAPTMIPNIPTIVKSELRINMTYNAHIH